MFRFIDSFQKSVFFVLLYASAVLGVLLDMAGIDSRTGLFLVYDGAIIFLALTSLSYLPSRLGYIALLMLACIVVNISYSPATLVTSLNGIREIVTIFALAIFYNKIFTPGNEELASSYIRGFKKYAIIFLILQLPFAFYQFALHGPSDYVGGTYGNFGSGLLTLSVICLVYFLFLFKPTFIQSIALYITLLPLLLNETKISFVLIPMMIIFIYFAPKVKNILWAVVAAFLFLIIFNRFYSHQLLDFDNNVAGIFSADFLDDYLFSEDVYEDIPRFTKIILGWHLLSQQLNTLLFGFEYGLFRGNLVGLSNFAQTYQWLLTGTRPYLFFLFLQGGVFLVTVFALLYAHINHFFKKNNNKFKNFLLLIFLLIMFYNDILRTQNFALFFFFLVFLANSRFLDPKAEAI